MDTAMFWIEYVLRNGGAEDLRLQTLDLSAMEYYGWDIALFLMAALAISIALLAACCKLCCYRKKCSNTKEKVKKN